MNDFEIEEYKRLCNEIARYQEQIFKTVSFATTASGALFALSFSQAIPSNMRWITLFTPWLILFPFVLLQAERSRATWRIGLYLKVHLEPKLNLDWSNFITNFYQHRDHKKVIKKQILLTYVWSSSLPLIFLQIMCPILSFLQNPLFPHWYILTIFLLITIIIQVIMLNRTIPNRSLEKRVVNIIESVITKMNE